MRAHLPSYELRRAKSLSEALKLLAAEPGLWRPLAGGTDLMVLFEAGKLSHKKHLSIWGLPELHGMKMSAKGLRIGALTSFGEIRDSALVKKKYPLLVRAACEVGAVAIQNRATIGGNIVNASPAADSPPALLVYDAELEIASLSQKRRVAYRDFHQGYKKMQLEPDELVTAIFLPKALAGTVQYYRKVGTRRAQAISKVCVAATARLEAGTGAGASRGGDGKRAPRQAAAPFMDDVRIAIGAVAPMPLRCHATEAVLRGQDLSPALIKSALESLLREIAPIDDIRSTADYRRAVAVNLVEEFLLSLL